MNLEDFSCQVCFEPFDLNDHLPRIITECGHTLCTECLSLLLTPSFNEPKCPLDRDSIKARKVEHCPINYALRRILESHATQDICYQHHRRKEFVCLVDKQLICANCALDDGEHFGHKRKAMKKVEAELQAKAVHMEDAVQKTETYFKETSNMLNQARNSLTDTISHRFEEMKRHIILKEITLLHQVNNLFESEIAALSKNLEDESGIKSRLVKKVSDCKQLFKHSGVFDLMDEVVEETTPKISLETIKNHTEKVGETLNQSLKSWEDTIRDQTDTLTKVSLPYEDVSEICAESFETIFNEPLRRELQNKGDLCSFKTRMEFEVEDDTLRITAQWKEPQEITVRLSDFEGIKKVKLELNAFMTNSEDKAAFYYVWNPLQISSLSISCGSKDICSGVVTNLLYIISSKAEKFTELELNFRNCTYLNDSLALFKSVFLRKMTRLESLSMNFMGTMIGDEGIKNFAKYNGSVLRSLKKFALNLQNTRVSDQAFQDLIVPMPQLLSYSLCLQETQVTDECARSVSANIISRAVDLEELSLNFQHIPLTDKGASQLLNVSKKLRKLHLYLGATNITGKTLKILGRDCLTNMHQLEDLKLVLFQNSIYNEDIAHICVAVPTLKKICLTFTSTEITDMKMLSTSLIRSCESLETLKLYLDGTNVTDHEVMRLLRNRGNLKSLSLFVKDTLVTDAFVKAFLKKVLPELDSLEDYKLNFNGTEVSQNMVDRMLRGLNSAVRKIEEEQPEEESFIEQE